jgi:chromosomal replication initiator protein
MPCSNCSLKNQKEFCWCLYQENKQPIKKACTPDNINQIKKQIAKIYGISVKDLESQKRYKHIVQARKHAMQLCRDTLGATLQQIGDAFGYRTTSTILHLLNS